MVRVSGVSGTLFNQRRQLIGIQHYVPSLDHVRVESPGPRDLFAAPVTAISQLTQFTVDAENAQRVRLVGVVTLRRAVSFFVKDATGSVEIQTRRPRESHPATRSMSLASPGLATTAQSSTIPW